MKKYSIENFDLVKQYYYIKISYCIILFSSLSNFKNEYYVF